MIRTFIDSGVLIAAARGAGDIAARALDILDDPDRILLSSDFVKLEVLPKAIFNQRHLEAEFYRTFFKSVDMRRLSIEMILKVGHDIASNNGLAPMDALHVAAAILLDADELMTTEKLTRSIHRAGLLKIVSIH